MLSVNVVTVTDRAVSQMKRGQVVDEDRMIPGMMTSEEHAVMVSVVKDFTKIFITTWFPCLSASVCPCVCVCAGVCVCVCVCV